MGAKMNHLSDEANHLTAYSEKQGEAVNRTRTSFHDIVQQVDLIQVQVNNVQQSLNSLNASSDQLASAFQDISAISEESAASAEEVAASSEHQLKAIEEVNQAAIQLQDLSQMLLEEVNKFELGADDEQGDSPETSEGDTQATDGFAEEFAENPGTEDEENSWSDHADDSWNDEAEDRYEADEHSIDQEEGLTDAEDEQGMDPSSTADSLHDDTEEKK
jgi:methyl-accepting chemotaxis protein